MRPVNLGPQDSRARSGPSSDPTVSYGIVAALGVLLVMVLFTIMQSNKATTLMDETAELQAQTAEYQAKATPVQKFNDFAEAVDKRTLLIGGLAESRFPWHTAMYNLAQAMPPDVTLDTATAKTATPAAEGTPAAGTEATTTNASGKPEGATIELAGCAAGWLSYARFVSRLKTMPGVLSVSGKNTNNSGNSDTPGQAPPNNGGGDSGGSEEDKARKKNCGTYPLTFTVGVSYAQPEIDLVGLPKIAAPAPAAGASGPTGATPPASGTPAAASSTGAN